MFGIKSIRLTGVLTLFFFVFFIFSLDFTLAKEEEDNLVKARKLYQQGDYEGSIKLLNEYIEKLKGVEVEEQKKNTAEAFYLMAKIYFSLGNDIKTTENLRKVFETYPAFEKAEINLRLRELVEKVKMAFQKETPTKHRVIEQPSVKKKKKKIPILLVVGGIAVVTVLAILLLKKEKDIEPEYDIRGDWTVTEEFFTRTYTYQITFSGSKTRGTFTDYNAQRATLENGTGTYAVTSTEVLWKYDVNDNTVFSGRFKDMDNMLGGWTTIMEETHYGFAWYAARGGSNKITNISSGTK